MPYKYNNKNKYTYTNLYEDFIIEHRNDEEITQHKLTKSQFIKILSDLDNMMFEEAIYHGTAITYPNLGIVNVLVENDTKLACILDKETTELTNKKTIKTVLRVNSGATRLNKKKLEAAGDFETDPTVYFERNFFAKIKFIKIYSKEFTTYNDRSHSKLISIFKVNPSNKFRKILASHLNNITKEIADNTYNDMLQNKGILQKNFII